MFDGTLPALTIRQPWADHVLADAFAKDVENRSWPTSYRGPLVVHAAREVDPFGVAFLNMPITAEQDRDRGHLLGLVDLVDVHRDGSPACAAWDCAVNPWAFHEGAETARVYHWRLEHPRRMVTPFRARGRVGLWPLSPSELHLLTIAEVVA